MSYKSLGKLIFVIFVLWGLLTYFALSTMNPGEPMGYVPQIFIYYVIPYGIWFILMYWFMKRIAAEEIKKHIDDAAEHRRKIEFLLGEISSKLDSEHKLS